MAICWRAKLLPSAIMNARQPAMQMQSASWSRVIPIPVIRQFNAAEIVRRMTAMGMIRKLRGGNTGTKG